MEFLIEECEKIDLKTKCGFDELSLYTEPFCTNCSIVIEKTHLTLDFDLYTKRILGLSGFVGELTKLSKTKIGNFTIVSDVKLFVDSSEKFVEGIGYELGSCGRLLYDDSCNAMRIVFEKRVSDSNQYYRVLDGVLVQLDQNELQEIVVLL